MNILQQITEQSQAVSLMTDHELATRLSAITSDKVYGCLALVNASLCLRSGIRSRHTAQVLADIAEDYGNEDCLVILEVMERLMEE